MSAADAPEPVPAPVPVVAPPSAPEPVATHVQAPWRALGWSDTALAALLGGPSVPEASR